MLFLKPYPIIYGLFIRIKRGINRIVVKRVLPLSFKITLKNIIETITATSPSISLKKMY